MDSSRGSIRIPIETNSEFQRAFSASFDRLPLKAHTNSRGPLVHGFNHRSIHATERFGVNNGWKD